MSFNHECLIFSAGMSNFGEPCHVVYDIENDDLDAAAHALKSLVPVSAQEDDVTTKCRKQRLDRVSRMDQAVSQTVGLDLRKVCSVLITRKDGNSSRDCEQSSHALEVCDSGRQAPPVIAQAGCTFHA